MTGREKLLKRMEANAESLCEAYPTSGALLQTAVSEAMTWAPALISGGRMPHKMQLERLATQIMAILIASLPPEPEPAAPLAVPEERTGAKVHSFK